MNLIHKQLEKMAENPVAFDPLLKGISQREWSLEEEAQFRRQFLAELKAQREAGGSSR